MWAESSISITLDLLSVNFSSTKEGSLENIGASALSNQRIVSVRAITAFGKLNHPQTQVIEDQLPNTWIIHMWVSIWGLEIHKIHVKCMNHILSEILITSWLQRLNLCKLGENLVLWSSIFSLQTLNGILNLAELFLWWNEIIHTKCSVKA